jgi:hypothetical protein
MPCLDRIQEKRLTHLTRGRGCPSLIAPHPKFVKGVFSCFTARTENLRLKGKPKNPYDAVNGIVFAQKHTMEDMKMHDQGNGVVKEKKKEEGDMAP